MNPSPKILISLVNWYKYDDTINCVRSIGELDYLNYEIVIVDNDSPNDSFTKLKEVLPSLHITKSLENNGYAAGHKINVDYAIKNNFDAIWILNSDVKLRKNTLSELVKAWQEKGNHLFGSVTLSQENPDIVDFGGGIDPTENSKEYIYNNFKGVSYESLPQPNIRSVQAVEGSSLFIPKDIIIKHGFMRLDFFMYAEECDYAHHLRKFRVNTYIVNSSVIIHNSASSFKLKTDIAWISEYYRTRNAMYFAKEYYHWSDEKIKSLKNIIKHYNLVYFFLKTLPYKGKYRKLYWRLRGSRHALKGITGKFLDPNKYVQN
ncbi:MAG: glycosyltransferase family 2 protein [Bacteroidales bacterium]|nr:glycosyltransferase family 2 protein [Bacteroidales bacterium]